VVDAGWSHPGYWARECVVIALCAQTRLPIGVQHVVLGENYNSRWSSKGMVVQLLTITIS
jgi:hypothetical protein